MGTVISIGIGTNFGGAPATITEINGTPSDLVVTTVSESTMKIDWTVGSSNHIGHEIHRSTNGTDYTLLDTVEGATATYNDTTVSQSTQYYYKVRAYYGSVYSDFTTAGNDWSAMKLSYIKGGTGASVAILKFTVITSNVTMTCDGDGLFYNNPQGTTNAGTTRTITTGAERTFYFKCATGSSNVRVFHKNNLTTWYMEYNSGNQPILSMGAADLARSITSFVLNCPNTVSGDFTDLPSQLTNFNVSNNHTFSGDTADLPRTLLSFYWQSLQGGTMTGAWADLPPNILGFASTSAIGTVTGGVSTLPRSLTSFTLGAASSLPGTFADFPSGLTSLSLTNVGSGNTITGTLADLPSGLLYLKLTGIGQRITGDVSTLPSGLLTCELTCYSPYFITGDLAAIPAGITYWGTSNTGNRIDTYTAGRTWSNSVNYIANIPATSYGFSETEVDNILIDLSTATWAGSGRQARFTTPNAPRSAASNTAVTTLEGKSVLVTTA